MVHYFLAALWWLKWVSPFAKTLQTLSTPAFSWQGYVIFKTGTFAQSCFLILSLGLYFTDTVILETAFAQSLSITPSSLFLCSALPPSVLHSFISHPPLFLVLLFLLHRRNTDKITCSSFSSGCVKT